FLPYPHELSFRRCPRHDSSRTVDGRVKGLARLTRVDPFNDYRIIAHAAADKSALSRKGGCRAFAHDPQLFAIMSFAPGEIVMVMHFLEDARSQNFTNHIPRHCFPPGISVLPGQSHSR